MEIIPFFADWANILALLVALAALQFSYWRYTKKRGN